MVLVISSVSPVSSFDFNINTKPLVADLIPILKYLTFVFLGRQPDFAK
jgi:hypothetical protein